MDDRTSRPRGGASNWVPADPVGPPARQGPTPPPSDDAARALVTSGEWVQPIPDMGEDAPPSPEVYADTSTARRTQLLMFFAVLGVVALLGAFALFAAL